MAAVAVLLAAMLALLGLFAFQILQVVDDVTADPADCQYEIDYGECSETCGDGTKTGTVTITAEASNGGECAYEDGETVTSMCNLGDCAGAGDPDETQNPTALDAFNAIRSSDGVCPNDPSNTNLTGVDFNSPTEANERLAQECLCNDSCKGFWYEFVGSATNFSADVGVCGTTQLNGVNETPGTTRYMFHKDYTHYLPEEKEQICDGYTTLMDEIIYEIMY